MNVWKRDKKWNKYKGIEKREIFKRWQYSYITSNITFDSLAVGLLSDWFEILLSFFLFQILNNRNSCISTYMNQNRSLILSNSIYLIFSRFTALIIILSNILFEILKCFHSINIRFLAHLDFSEHIFSGVLAPVCLYTWIFSSSYFRLFENYCTSIVVDNI